MRKRIPRIRFGAPKLDAALAKWSEAIEWACGISAVAPLKVTQTAAGPLVTLAEPTTIFARLDANSGGGAYTFTEVYLNSSGGWTVKTGGYTGTAKEWNGNASVPVSPTRYVQLRWFGEVDEWRFQSGAC